MIRVTGRLRDAIDEQELTLNTVFGGDLSGTLRALIVGVPPQGNVGTSFRKTVGDSETDTGASTSNDGGLALQREHTQQARVLRGSSVLVDEETILNGVGSHYGGVFYQRVEINWGEGELKKEEVIGRSGKRKRKKRKSRAVYSR